MSNESNPKKSPELAAGEEIIERCPLCGARFQEAVAANIKHKCPACEDNFCVMTYSK